MKFCKWFFCTTNFSLLFYIDNASFGMTADYNPCYDRCDSFPSLSSMLYNKTAFLLIENIFWYEAWTSLPHFHFIWIFQIKWLWIFCAFDPSLDRRIIRKKIWNFTFFQHPQLGGDQTFFALQKNPHGARNKKPHDKQKKIKLINVQTVWL